jgi:hypothetical protein
VHVLRVHVVLLLAMLVSSRADSNTLITPVSNWTTNRLPFHAHQGF